MPTITHPPASHNGQPFAGYCRGCQTEYYGTGEIEREECSECRGELCHGCKRVCECGRLFCEHHVSRYQDLMVCADCRAYMQREEALERIQQANEKQSAALSWALDRVFGRSA